MAEQKDKIIGGFRVLQEIQVGAGSQGTVYKAVCEEDKHGLVPVGTLVALKVMAVQDEGGNQWRKLQKRTAELVRLKHPNVVRYYGCFSEQGLFNDVHVVVQEFLQGETLKEKLARSSTGLDVDVGIKVVDSTLAGLEYTTRCGIVHRDLKPGNIFLCDNGGVKLIDFEIAKQEGGTATASVGNIRGSFDYMAPDFTDPEFHGDVQSDVFSMGVVLHEVLCGKAPYERLEGDDKQANFAFLSRWSQTLSDGHSPIHVSSRIKRLLSHADAVIVRALAPKREERYPDFTSFREALKTIRFRSLKNGKTSYQLLQFIGKGGFGEVFKARDRQTGQLVAVKHLMKAAYAERFKREAKIMQKLHSPCFVQFVDFFVMEVGGGQEAFLVMAFLDGMPGSSLRDAIKHRAESPMEWRDVFVAFARYARGLLAMHSMGVFHRDIKPSNLYYPPGRPQGSAIMDFGIARDVNGTATQGQVPGTLDYMPPEVVISDSRGDGGMDIYALGLCLYEALTGKMAFPRLPTGSTAYATFFERAKARRTPNFDAPEVAGDEEILTLLRDMTNPDESRRLRNAGVLLKRIESIIEARFKGAELEGDYGPATVAATVAMPGGGDPGTVATSAIEPPQAAAIERERRRVAKAGGFRKFQIVSLAVLLVGLAGAVAYRFLRSAPEEPAANVQDPAVAATGVGQDAAQDEAQRRLEEQSAQLKRQQEAMKKQQDEMERQRQELEKQRKKIEAEREEDEARRKAEEEKLREDREKLDAEAARIRDDKTKTAAEKAAEQKRIAAEKAKLEDEAKARDAAEKARRDKALAAQNEEQRKLAEQAETLKAQQETIKRQQLELEKERETQKKKLEEERKAEEERKKREKEEQDAATRKAIEEARIKAEDEARKKIEAQMAAQLAEMQRKLKEAEDKAAKEKAARDAEAKRLEAERKRLDEQRKAEEEARRIAAEKEKAAREAEAKRLEEEKKEIEKRQKQIEEDRIAAAKAREKAEADRRKAEEEAKRIASQTSQRAANVKDLVAKAGMFYESEEYYDAVSNYHEAVKNGYSLSADELREFEDAYRKAEANLKGQKDIYEEQIRQGRNFTRDIRELEAKSKNLKDWHFDVVPKH